jgi:hypothetical protein
MNERKIIGMTEGRKKRGIRNRKRKRKERRKNKEHIWEKELRMVELRKERKK